MPLKADVSLTSRPTISGSELLEPHEEGFGKSGLVIGKDNDGFGAEILVDELGAMHEH